MENKTLLAIVLSFLVLVLYQWLFVPAQKRPPAQPVVQQGTAQQIPRQALAQAQGFKPLYTPEQPSRAKAIYVDTPFYDAELSTNNLTILHWYLKDYRTGLEGNSPYVDLIDTPSNTVHPMWESFDGSSFSVPANIDYACSDFTLTIKKKDARADIVCSYDGHGIGIKKIITFYGNSYTATVEIAVENRSDKPMTERLGVNWIGLSGELGSRYNIADGIVLINDNRETVEAKSLNLSKSYDGLIEWFGIENVYFIQTVLPHEPTPSHLYATKAGTGEKGLIPLMLTYIYNPDNIAPGSTRTRTYTVFIGPKAIDVLNSVGSSLSRAIYFGWANVIAKPLFYVLRFIDNFTGNYGWAIVLLTILIKVLLFPLGQMSYKSMRQMQKLAPKINEIKEKYKNDKERLYKETTNLYRSYKINPLGGCLPMLLQIPIFFALYDVLLAAIELRHAPFIWWINDLSAPDTIGTLHLMNFSVGIHVLPLVMGVTMFAQQALTPTTTDPAQTKLLLWFMPMFLTVILWGFPSGLALYWTMNNLFSIGQQYYILKKY
ncbi:MAG: membrane protein insertase YidC [Deltaproteobacteria bacterium]|nr:membrane protein insertase YidC [Deltaproteobacteria bacterium]MCL5276682.1 membrane protein insertase YidC [Deltaproteobacteria bacterium]